MATYFSDVRSRLTRLFGNNAFEWVDRSYVLDWAMTFAVWFIVGIVKQLPPFEREFDRKDPLIDHKHHSSQISGALNWNVAFFLPLAIMTVVGILRRSALDVHHGCLALWADMGFSALVTEVLKNRVGRLRPDFLSRCKWDKTLKACTGDLETLQDGRRSFPSGHSSTAFAGMMFLSLWIASMTGAWSISQPAPARSFLASKLARLTLSLLPLVFATWVAVSRLEDNRHHKEDVIVGSLIGISSATIFYLVYWPGPFADAKTVARGSAPHARDVYTNGGMITQENGYSYELAGVELPNGVGGV